MDKSVHIFVPIPGFEKYYFANRQGKIYSAHTNDFVTPNIRKNGAKGRGYGIFTFCKTGTRKKVYIHRIIAETFISNPQNKKCVNHKNGIKTDNRVENLEWCSHKENMKHAFKTGINNTISIFNSVKRKKVINTQTNKVYSSINLACKDLNVKCVETIRILLAKKYSLTPLRFYNGKK